jgi:hypothetical protein
VLPLEHTLADKFSLFLLQEEIRNSGVEMSFFFTASLRKEVKIIFV